MVAVLRRLAGLVLDVADYLTTRLPPHVGEPVHCPTDDVYCECPTRGDDAHARR